MNDTSFKVLWETSLPARGYVKLGVAEFNVLKPKLDQLFREESNSSYHNVLVDGLKPGEHYFYEAISINEIGDTLSGTITPITVPDYNKMPVSFAVIGDTQNSPHIWRRLSELIYQEHPSFIVHLGDLVQYGPDKEDWVDDFFKPAKDILRFYPLYPAIGNHENNSIFFYQYFDLPLPEWFYTLRKGNVLFIFADTNKDILPGSKQYRNLEKALASSSAIWKIVVHHHPIYVSEEGFYGNTWFQRSVHGDPNVMHLKRLYETYGVDLVLNGHAHFYERTWPISSEQVDIENGVVYITSGGGNDEYSKFSANKSWYDARTRVTNHFLSINIVSDNLYGSAIDSAGNVFDNFTLTKNPEFKRLNTTYFGGQNSYFIDSLTVSIQNLNETGKISYCTDNKNYIVTNSKEVKTSIFETTTISSFIQNEKEKSITAIRTFEKLPLMTSAKKVKEELKADYYEGNWIALPDFEKLKPIKTFFPDSINLDQIQPRAKDHFAVRFSGSFEVSETGVYRFYLESFDGSRLLVDESEIIDNDGIHYEIKKEKFIALEKGIHNFEVQYFDYVRRETLNLKIGKQNGEMVGINRYIKVHKK